MLPNHAACDSFPSQFWLLGDALGHVITVWKIRGLMRTCSPPMSSPPLSTVLTGGARLTNVKLLQQMQDPHSSFWHVCKLGQNDRQQQQQQQHNNTTTHHHQSSSINCLTHFSQPWVSLGTSASPSWRMTLSMESSQVTEPQKQVTLSGGGQHKSVKFDREF
jgi:hypothetical protein